MLAIYKRELKSYFNSFIGFLFIAVTLFFLSLYFSVYNLISGSPYFSRAVAGTAFIFLVSVPILTMKVLAEEKRSKTDQLILTAPVSVGSIVVGKFFALITIFLIPVAFICTYPLIMSRFGSVPMGQAYLAILAYFLFGMTAIAIGLFVSSLTESQVIAAVLGFAILFIGYMMSSICSVISSTGNWITKILGCFDLYTHFGEMLNGTLNLVGVVYYVSLTALVLFLTVQSIQKRRYSVSVDHFSVGAYSTGMIAVAVAVVVVLNVIMGEMPVTWTSLDITSEKLYSITDATKEFVSGIQEDVTIYVLANEDNQDTTVGQTLQKYDALSDHIKVEYVDPTVNPQFYKNYTDSLVTSNSLIVVSDKRSKVIDYNSLYEASYDYTTYTSSTTGYDGEGQITSALDYVLTDDMPKIYLTEGHGEATVSGTFSAGLKKQNVEYDTINLMNYDAVPEDAAALFIDGATKDLSSDDKDKVIAYLEKGGSVVLVTAYTGEATPNLDAVMEYMGMSLADGLVVDQTKDNYYRSPYYLLPNVEVSTYTSGVYGKGYVFAPFAQGILIDNEEAEGMTYKKFLTTSDDAYAKANISNMDSYDKEEGDVDGPFSIGVSAEKSLEDGNATLIVVGCQQFFTDDASTMVSGTNLTVFTNIMGSFTHHESNVSIPVKEFNTSQLMVTQFSVFVLSPLLTIVLPVAFLIAGFVIWLRRRKR